MEDSKYAVSGYIGGMFGIFVAHPFDTIRIREQVDGKNFSSGMIGFQKTVRNEGFMALFKGVVPPLIGLGFMNSVLFGAYGAAMSRLEDRDSRYKNIFIAGCIGGAAQTPFANTNELLKIRMQMNTGNPISTWEAGKHVLKKEGFVGLNRGFVATFIRDGPSYGNSKETALSILNCKCDRTLVYYIRLAKRHFH